MYTFEALQGLGEDEIVKPTGAEDALKEDPLATTGQGDITNGDAGTPPTPEKAGIPWTWIVLGVGILAVAYFVIKNKD